MNMKIDESPFDLDYMLGLVDNIALTQEKLSKAELALELYRAEITHRATNNVALWVGGKQPSMAYIKANYHVIGYDDKTKDDLMKLATDVIRLQSEHILARKKFEVEKEKLDVWRTLSANVRNSVSFIGNS